MSSALVDLSVLKTLSTTIQTSNFKERVNLFEELNNVLIYSKLLNETNESTILKGIFKVLQLTLDRYNTKKSRNLIIDLIKKILKKYENASKFLISSVYNSLIQIKPSGLIASRKCLTFMKWLSLIECFDKLEFKEEKSFLFKCHAIIVSHISKIGYKNHNFLLTCYMQNTLKKNLNYIQELSKIEIDTDNSMFVFNLWEFLFLIQQNEDKIVLIKKFKQIPIDLLSKFIIPSKTKISREDFYKYSSLIIENIEKDDFEKHILPATQKSVLRSAETTLPVINYMINSLKIDLSLFIEALNKLIVSHLIANNDELRELSSACYKSLAKKSESETVINVVKELILIYNGSQGKLIKPEHKQAVLEAIGNLSFSKNLSQKSIEFVFTELVNITKSEVHESTIVCILKQINKWSLKFDSNLPNSFFESLKNIHSLKKNLPFIKENVYLILRNTISENNTEKFKFFDSQLSSSIKSGIELSNFNQFSLISESLFASNCLLTLHSLNSNYFKDSNSEIFNFLINNEKLSFLSEKFLELCPVEYLNEVLEFISLFFATGLINKSQQEKSIFILLHLMNFKSSYQLRTNAFETCKKVFKSCKESNFINQAMDCFIKLYRNYDISSENSKSDQIEVSKLNPTSNSLVLCLKNICSLKETQKIFLDEPNYFSFFLDFFIPCHLPVVYSSMNSLWLKLLNYHLKMENVQTFISNNLSSLVELSYLDVNDINFNGSFYKKTQENCMKTLVSYYPEQFLPVFIKDIISSLNKKEFVSITKTEFEIFKTPENELYDMSVIGTNDEFNIKNIKKENKLYSYKEQIEELKLKQELVAKRKNVELNPKQKQAKADQLKKESLIREKIKVLNASFEIAIFRLNTIIKGNPLFFSFYLKDIIPTLIDLFQSYLCAEECSKTFLSLVDCVSDKNCDISYTIKSISYVILRQFNVKCQIDPNWTCFDLNEIEIKLLDHLYSLVCSDNFDEDFIEKISLNNDDKKLKATAFAYIFPFISNLLIKRKKVDDTYDKLLNIISKYVTIEYDEAIEELEDLAKNPVYLPRKDLCKVLLSIIGQKFIIIAKKANKVFLQLSKCLSNYPETNESLNEILLIIIENFNSNNDLVRVACLDCLNDQLVFLSNLEENSYVYEKFIKTIWIGQFDSNLDCESKSTDIWMNCNLKLNENLCKLILDDILIYKENLMHAVSNSLAEVLLEYQDQAKFIFENLSKTYKEIAIEFIPVVDEFGRPLNRITEDNYVPRYGIALILTKIASFLPNETSIDVIDFLVNQALKDVNEKVRKQMLSVGIAIIDKTPRESLHNLLKIFQKFLNEVDNSKETDKVRASVVVLTGSLAGKLDKNDPQIKPIIIKLIETLSTPSQMVQESVAFCLPALVPSIKEEIPTLIENLFKLLLDSDNYGEKKGAAYGIAGFIKGSGILSINKLGIIEKCKKAIQHKKPSRKLGALIAYEVFSNVLGRLFEPYVIKLIPCLFTCFGDASENVRKTTYETSKVIMNKLTAYGVKFILPSLLEALNQENWRTKVGSVEMLGAMAYCVSMRNILGEGLPVIVPRLMTLVCDSHSAVQKAANDALKQIGYVIGNPEIQEIVPILLNALDDPANKTQKCLETMLNTKFVHFIDAPSLALIMPVIERAFQARSTKTRKMAAQIIGNMYSLTDQKDLAPYLPAIIPGIKQSLLDPVPDVRAATARALGAMAKGIGDNIIDDVLPWLMKTLVSDTNSVDRSGAAQGLSEVIGGLGRTKLHKLMPDIIATTERNDIEPNVKDGYLMLYIYLPIVFPQDFSQYIGKIIHPILHALADENEYVRETAFKAGQRIVNLYASSAIQLLLPELEQGLFNENWRIRYSSVQLLGDLLYKISGVSGKMTTETASEDDNFGTEKSFKAILSALGEERRNRVLSGLYIGRLDISLSVRQASLHVWKIIVSNTPRTLKEIMPTLFTLILSLLASKSYDQQQVAARTLGDLVKKLGQRILPQIIPILEKGLDSEEADQRQGVCIGLSEIMASTSKEMVEAFVESLVPTIKKALYDQLSVVRQAAAKTFDSLHSAVGNRALEEIIPHLLDKLDDPIVGEYVLDGLKQILTIKSNAVLPYLIPQLTVTPINIRALSFLSCVTGDSLTKHLLKILPALLNVLSTSIDKEDEKQNCLYCKKILLSITDEQGSRTIIEYLFNTAKSEDKKKSLASVMMLNMYCCNSTANLSIYMSILIRGLIHLMINEDEKVITNTWETFNAVSKFLSSKELIEYIPDIRTSIQFAFSDYKSINKKNKEKNLLMPGFCWSKGIHGFLPYFKDALSIGNPEQKEQATICLIEIIKLTNTEGLKTSVVIFAGALIRILGDARNSTSLKVSVIETLTLMLEKIGSIMKQFMPQLQQSFLKSLNDPNKSVRMKAANALGFLVLVHQKCDVVISEIHTALSQSTEENVIKETYAFAIRACLIQAGEKFSLPVKTSIMKTVLGLLDNKDESLRTNLASLLGTLCKWISENDFDHITKNHLLEYSNQEELNHGRSLALRICLKESPERLIRPENNDKILKILTNHISSDKVAVAINGLKATAYYILYNLVNNLETPTQLLTVFSKGMNHSNNDIKKTVAFSTSFIAKNYEIDMPLSILKIVTPLLVNGTKEKNTVVKANSEQALITIFKLREKDELINSLMNILEPGPRESLEACLTKTLRRVASNPEPKDNENFDETLVI